jgi:GT2 family glycosyltransferase
LRHAAKSTHTQLFGPEKPAPSLSVIIVAYNTDELEEGLRALAIQKFEGFETIVVDNDSESLEMLAEYDLRYFKLDRNHGLSAGRNFAAEHAHAPVLAFLDDDAIPDEQWTARIHSAFADPEVVGVRGTALPRTATIFNHLAYHYNLGDEVVPAMLDFEANIATRTAPFREVNGFDPALFGGEGSELSKRLSPYGKLLYIPDLVVRHDYADSMRHYLRKQYRHAFRRHTQVLAGTYDPGPELPAESKRARRPRTQIARLQVDVIQRLGDYADLAGILAARLSARWRSLRT